MKRNFPFIASLALVTLLVACAPSATQEKSAVQQSLTEDEAFRLGVDAYVYGYPLLVMNSVRRVMSNVAAPEAKSAPMGQFAHFRSFPDASKRDRRV